MDQNTVIKVDNVTKMYKLYDNPKDRLKEALIPTKKKRYKEHYALNGVSFDVKKGETVGIIGTNGSGKSTILKIITGVLNPTSGKVEIGNSNDQRKDCPSSGTGCRLQFRVHRNRECLPEWNHEWIFQGRDR